MYYILYMCVVLSNLSKTKTTFKPSISIKENMK